MCIYASVDWVINGSGNSLAPVQHQPLPELMTTLMRFSQNAEYFIQWKVMYKISGILF